MQALNDRTGELLAVKLVREDPAKDSATGGEQAARREGLRLCLATRHPNLVRCIRTTSEYKEMRGRTKYKDRGNSFQLSILKGANRTCTPLFLRHNMSNLYIMYIPDIQVPRAGAPGGAAVLADGAVRRRLRRDAPTQLRPTPLEYRRAVHTTKNVDHFVCFERRQ